MNNNNNNNHRNTNHHSTQRRLPFAETDDVLDVAWSPVSDPNDPDYDADNLVTPIRSTSHRGSARSSTRLASGEQPRPASVLAALRMENDDMAERSSSFE